MTDATDEMVAEIKAGLEGVTPGPWRQCGGMSASYRAIHSPSGYIVYGMADATTQMEHGTPIAAPGWDEQDRNARHIARCSPDNIAALLSRIAAAEAENARLAAELAEARKIVEPFAKHIDKMKFDIDYHGNPLPDDQVVGWIYVTNGDFRAARAWHEKQGEA